MRSRKFVMIASFLMAWTFVTYYYLLGNNPTHVRSVNRHLSERVQQLETDAKHEYKKSERLMGHVIDMLKLKYRPPPIDEAEEQAQAEAQAQVPAPGSGLRKKPDIDIVALPADQLLSLQQPPSQEQIDTTTNNSTTFTLPVKTHLATGEPIIPVLVFACNRVTISKCLDNLLQYRPDAERFPIIISQDCGDEATRNVIMSYTKKAHNVLLIEQPDQSDIFVPPKEKKFKGYYKIARHYGWALNTTFQRGYEFVIIVEDDLNVSPDFYEYFYGTYSLLKQDSSLWCVSAWNDNGKANFIDSSRADLLYRTDFFPGLGWMLTRELWAELSVKWPKSFWDDWIRHPEQRKNRVCIRPEISRTKTFGKVGVSNGLFFDKYLKHIKLSEDFIEFTKLNLSYLLRDNYDRTFVKEVYTYPIITYDELRRNLISQDGPMRIQYTTKDQYKRVTKMLGLMDDLKSGVPRTGYHGIVSFFYNKRRVHIAPNANWKGYDLSWS